MTTSIQIYKGQAPTKEQRQEIREAAKRTPVYDELAPELSIEQMQRYRKAAIDKKAKTAVTLELSKENMDKAHSFGEEYRAVLSRLLELAMNDSDLVRKARHELLKSVTNCTFVGFILSHYFRNFML